MVASPAQRAHAYQETLTHLQHMAAAGRDAGTIRQRERCCCDNEFPVGKRLNALRTRWEAVPDDVRQALTGLGFVLHPREGAFAHSLAALHAYAARHPHAPPPQGTRSPDGTDLCEFYRDLVRRRFALLKPEDQAAVAALPFWGHTFGPGEAQRTPRARALVSQARRALTEPRRPAPGPLLVELRLANHDGGSLREEPVMLTLEQGATFAGLLAATAQAITWPASGGVVLVPARGRVDPVRKTLPDGVTAGPGGELSLDAVITDHAGVNWVLLVRPAGSGRWFSARLRDAHRPAVRDANG